MGLYNKRKTNQLVPTHCSQVWLALVLLEADPEDCKPPTLDNLAKFLLSLKEEDGLEALKLVHPTLDEWRVGLVLRSVLKLRQDRLVEVYSDADETYISSVPAEVHGLMSVHTSYVKVARSPLGPNTPNLYSIVRRMNDSELEGRI